MSVEAAVMDGSHFLFDGRSLNNITIISILYGRRCLLLAGNLEPCRSHTRELFIFLLGKRRQRSNIRNEINSYLLGFNGVTLLLGGRTFTRDFP